MRPVTWPVAWPSSSSNSSSSSYMVASFMSRWGAASRFRWSRRWLTPSPLKTQKTSRCWRVNSAGASRQNLVNSSRKKDATPVRLRCVKRGQLLSSAWMPCALLVRHSAFCSRNKGNYEKKRGGKSYNHCEVDAVTQVHPFQTAERDGVIRSWSSKC